MRSRIAPELDSLMWTLVEQGNPRAMDEFLARYPELKGELQRRSAMVSGLKKMKDGSEVKPTRPPFRQVEHVRYQSPRRMTFVVAGLALAALGAASFTVTYLILPKAEPAPSKVVLDPKPAPVEKFTEDGKPLNTQGQVSTTPGPEDEPPLVKETPRWAKPIGIKLANAPMHTVFKLIEAQSGLKVEIAPGTPNPSVDVAYEPRPPMEILEDMGRQHGFTPMDQGDGLVIIVPAVDPAVATKPTNPRQGNTDAR